MTFADKSNRRTFLGALSALSAALMRPRKLFAVPAAGRAGGGTKLTGFGSTGNVYEHNIPAFIDAAADTPPCLVSGTSQIWVTT